MYVCSTAHLSLLGAARGLSGGGRRRRTLLLQLLQVAVDDLLPLLRDVVQRGVPAGIQRGPSSYISYQCTVY